MPESTREDWIRIEQEFAERWNFPNCCGSLDGKHIMITSPAKSGTLYYNYKGHFSLNLMALVDANYKFITVDVGDYGSNADGAVFRKSAFGQRFLDNDMDVPPPKTILNAEHLGSLPYVIVADEAFPLKPNIMISFGFSFKPLDNAVFKFALPVLAVFCLWLWFICQFTYGACNNHNIIICGWFLHHSPFNIPTSVVSVKYSILYTLKKCYKKYISYLLLTHCYNIVCFVHTKFNYGKYFTLHCRFHERL